jgi:hypothetical protein
MGRARFKVKGRFRKKIVKWSAFTNYWSQQENIKTGIFFSERVKINKNIE